MKLILTSHGNFCTGIFSSYQMIAGENVDITAVPLTDSGIEIFTQQLNSLLDKLVETDEVLVLTDIKGGTPYNEAFNYFLRNSQKLRVVSGMNLPMVLESGLNLQNSSLDTLYSLALDAGRNGIEGIEEIEIQKNDIEF